MLRVAAAYAAFLALITCVLEIATSWHVGILNEPRVEWVLWMPVASVIGMLAIVLRCGSPRGLAHTVVFVLLNLLLIAVARSLWRGELLGVLWLTLDAFVRLALAACWVGVACGVVAIPVWLKRRAPSTPAPIWVKLWFAAALSLGLAESATRLIHDQPRRALELPRHWGSRDPDRDEFRIAAIGGSTMRGFPYEPKIDIVTICQAQLEARYPERTIIVDNVARTGINLREAIERLETAPARPDLIVVYSGHNEIFFDVDTIDARPGSGMPILDAVFQWSSAYRAFSNAVRNRFTTDRELADLGRRLFDTPLFTEEVARKRLLQFRQTLIEFARFCRQKNIELVWFIPAAGEGTFEPNRSWAGHHVDADRQESVERLLAEAREIERAGRWSEAEDIYRELQEEHAGFAEFHYRLAECLVAQDRFMEAKQWFRAAVDCDGFPCQATSDYRQCIVDVAEQERIPVIDAEEVLSAVTGSGLLDRTVIHDHVHPTLAGYDALGRALAELSLVQSLAAGDSDVGSVDSESVDFSALLSDSNFNADDLGIAYERIGFALDHLAVRRYEESRRHAEAAQYRRWAEGLRTGEIQPGDDGTESLSEFQPGGVRLPFHQSTTEPSG